MLTGFHMILNGKIPPFSFFFFFSSAHPCTLSTLCVLLSVTAFLLFGVSGKLEMLCKPIDVCCSVAGGVKTYRGGLDLLRVTNVHYLQTP